MVRTEAGQPGRGRERRKSYRHTICQFFQRNKTETESAFAAGFAKQLGNIEFLILAIGSVVFFTLLLVTGNTMAISVRERTGELAVLKAIGFSGRAVMFFVLAES